MSDGGTDQFEMQSKEADSKSIEDIAQTSSQGNDQFINSRIPPLFRMFLLFQIVVLSLCRKNKFLNIVRKYRNKERVGENRNRTEN